MVSLKPSTSSLQQKPHKPIRYTAAQVALMAQFANDLSPAFCQAATPHLSQAFLGFHLDVLVSDDTPFIPASISHALGLKQTRGGFTWNPR